MNLPEDLQRILNVGAKVYDTSSKKQGRVIDKSTSDIIVDYSKNQVRYSIAEFCELLTSDVIVANHRLTMGEGNQFKVMPRVSSVQPKPQSFNDIVDKSLKAVAAQFPTQAQPKPAYLEIGYVNFATGRFSAEPKKGYTKVEYKKATEKVTLEVDSETLEKLKEMGLLK